MYTLNKNLLFLLGPLLPSPLLFSVILTRKIKHKQLVMLRGVFLFRIDRDFVHE